MVNLIIDRKPVSVPEGTTILEAARSVNIEIPTLCYLKGVNEIAACRLCMVEIEGYPRLVPSCDNVVAEGMVVHTNSPRAREARRVNMRLLLSQHDTHCTKCTRSGNCKLQKLTNDYNLLGDHYIKDLKTTEDDFSNPVVRIENRCVRCMRCVQVCDKIQSMNIWDLMGTGSRTTIGVGKTRRLGDSDCTFCGQCIIHCPVGALQERDDTGRVFDALADPGAEGLARGFSLFSIGLAKKILLADSIALYADAVFNAAEKAFPLNGTEAWLGSFCYTFQLYFDFSGYTDMALGLGLMLGLRLPENFNSPYKSTGIVDFWRRWHITLSAWLRDFLYIPLGGNRSGRLKQYRNLFLTMLIGGAWHGAGWTYILWGLWHGVLVSGEGLLKAPIEKLRQKRGGRVVMHVYTLLAVILGFAMFRAYSVQQGFLLIARMFSFAGAGAAGLLAAEEILTGARIAALVGGTVLSLPVVPALTRRCTGRGWEIVWNILALLGLLAAILALSGGSFTPFIYQQF